MDTSVIKENREIHLECLELANGLILLYRDTGLAGAPWSGAPCWWVVHWDHLSGMLEGTVAGPTECLQKPVVHVPVSFLRLFQKRLVRGSAQMNLQSITYNGEKAEESLNSTKAEQPRKSQVEH